jgi:hypothetical protein
MSVRRIGGITLAAALTVVLIGERRPLMAADAPDEHRGFSIFDYKGGCDHGGDTTKATLDVSDENKLIWWISNSCKLDQDVRLCVYKEADKTLYDPLRKCSPSNRDVGTIFPVKSRHDVEVKCKGLQKGKYLKRIEVGSDIVGDKCPDPMPSPPPPTRTHVLDVEIVP